MLSQKRELQHEYTLVLAVSTTVSALVLNEPHSKGWNVVFMAENIHTEGASHVRSLVLLYGSKDTIQFISSYTWILRWKTHTVCER